jgi:hypothetical protein
MNTNNTAATIIDDLIVAIETTLAAEKDARVTFIMLTACIDAHNASPDRFRVAAVEAANEAWERAICEENYNHEELTVALAAAREFVAYA